MMRIGQAVRREQGRTRATEGATANGKASGTAVGMAPRPLGAALLAVGAGLLVAMTLTMVQVFAPSAYAAGAPSSGASVATDLMAYDPGALGIVANGVGAADSATEGAEQPDEESADPLLATQASLSPASTSNLWEHNYEYDRWAKPTTSFLHVVDGSLERVEYTGGKLVVETVSSNFKGITAQKVIPASTYQPSNLASSSNFLWGGFYSGYAYNFVVTGQTNYSESNDVVVFRITKYSKSWDYLGAAELRGANTYIPFDAGSCDMVEYGGNLYVRTSHEMFATNYDSRHHQANVHIVVNESTMSVVQQGTNVYNQSNAAGYVSHSFNQRLAVLYGVVYGLDHGDAYPRAITVKKIGGSYANVMSFSGDTGDNDTGATMGGFESSSTTGRLLSVGNRTYDYSTTADQRNVWVAATTTGLSSSVRYLTSYDGSSNTWADNPFLVKIEENRFLVLWGIDDAGWNSHTNQIAYQFVDGYGNALTQTYTKTAALSDCQPVLYNGNIVWYAGDGARPVYYSIGAYSGSLTSHETLAAANVEYEGQNYTYYDWRTGGYVKAIPYYRAMTCPGTLVTLNGRELVKGTDYTLSYKLDHAKCQGVITVVGKGALKGTSRTVRFDVIPENIESCDIEGLVDKSYTGAAQTQSLKVTYGSGTFIQGTDYSLSYKNNVNVGTATVTVKGKGLLAGTRTLTFSITKGKLKSIALSKKAYTYNGKAKKPAATVKNSSGTVLKAGTDYTLSYKSNVNAGTATVVAKGKGNYTGSVKATFTIKPASLASVTPKTKAYTYNGKAKKPAATVKNSSGTVLKAGTDYTLSYKNNVNAGTATVVAKGKGNYTGSKSATFTIKKAQIKSVSLSPAKFVYNGKARSSKVTVKDAYGNTLKSGTDYKVSAPSGRTKPGTYTYKVVGKGNYAGSATAKMTIVRSASITRLYGSNALDTMKAIVEEGKWGKGGTVVLTTSDGYWDALTAAGIAGLAKAPVLMTNGSSLSPQTKALVKSLSPKTVIVCGGKAAVSDAVAKAAASAAGGAKVVRAAGSTATGTAVSIYKSAPSATSGKWSTTAFVCTNAGYWDALAAAPISYAKHMPIFLTEGRYSLSNETLSAMKGKVKRVYIVGGTSAVATSVETQLKNAGIAIAGRLAGSTAIETSEAVAAFGLSAQKMSANNMGVATSGGYWDALSGAALCGRKGSVLVLVDGPSSHSITSFVKSKAGQVTNLYVFGGTSAVSSKTEAAIKTALK